MIETLGLSLFLTSLLSLNATAAPNAEKGMMGVGLASVPPVLAAHLPEDARDGLLLNQIYDDSPADKAGLRQFDVVLAVDGVPVRSYESLNDTLEKREPGDEVDVLFVRGGERRTVSVTLVRGDELRAPAPAGPGTGGGGAGRVGVGPDGRVYVWPDAATPPAAPRLPVDLRTLDRLRELRLPRTPAPPAELRAEPREPAHEPRDEPDRYRDLERRMDRIERLLERLLER